MPSDPVIYQDTAKPGTMRHTFTGVRPQFSNKAIHKIIESHILPLRRELLQRPEFRSDAMWTADLVTLVQQGLDTIAKEIKQYTYRTDDIVAGKSLDERLKRQQEYMTKANAKGTSLEALALDTEASHADEMTQPADQRIGALSFDWTGEDADYAQPTPGRIPNSGARVVIIGLDRLLVEMTVSNSADHPRSINEYDAATFQTQLADLFNVAAQAGSESNPYLPTGTRRSQLDQVWNADGTYDPTLMSGTGGAGEIPQTAETK